MRPNKWEIWLVDMPFEDVAESKCRPALVIDSQNSFVLVGKMTSKPPRNNYLYEYQMIEWKNAGLSYQTTLRLSKRVKLELSAFIKKLGVIQPIDQVNVRNMLHRINS